MKVVIQRVKESSVKVDNKISGQIASGLLVLLGIGRDDGKKDVDYLADKIVNLRVFEDEDGKMNLSAIDLKKEILLVSQFTLYGDCFKGRRPSFFNAAPPEEAEKLYDYFLEKVSDYPLNVETGVFQAMMDVSLINDGPVTLIIDTDKISL